MGETWPLGELVEVEWVDSASTRGWRQRADWEREAPDEGLSTCRSAGYLGGKDRQAVRLFQSQSIHGGTAEQICIPRAAVKSIRKLKHA